MQDETKILYQSIGKVLKQDRLNKNISYTNFCYENDIPMTTYDDIIAGRYQSTFYNIFKIVRALGMNLEEFGKLVDKELPPEIWEMED